MQIRRTGVLFLPMVLLAQAPNPTQSDQPVVTTPTVVFRTTVTARTVKAINYNHRQGSTTIGFAGTALMPGVGTGAGANLGDRLGEGLKDLFGK